MKDKTLSDAQIIQRAIKKAVDNGWKTIVAFDIVMPYTNETEFYSIIFDKDFAKAFWGELPIHRSIVWNEMGNINSKVWEMIKPYIKKGNLKHWQYHLQEMVISENPIKYLSQFL